MSTVIEAAIRATRRSVWQDGCLVFTGARSSFGHGQIRVERRTRTAHRIVWEAANGPIPEGACILHHCDNPPCLNIEHLFLGTKADNSADMVAKRRHGNQRKTECSNGHPLEGDNVRVVSSGSGRVTRICVACRLATSRRYKQRVRAG